MAQIILTNGAAAATPAAGTVSVYTKTSDKKLYFKDDAGLETAAGNATHTGDATGATALTVVAINGTSMAGLATGLLKNTTTTGVPSIAAAGTDYVAPSGALGTPSSGTLTNCTFPTLNQNTTGSAATLTTPHNIDGQAFNGSADITVIAPGTHAATSKTTPVDADELPLVDSAASNVLKSLTWANIKATLKTYFDTLYQPTSGKDASGGYAGLTLFKLNLKNAANTFTNFFTNATTAARTWTLPDKDGTVAMTSDITDANGGTTGGSTTAYTLTPSQPWTSYVDGMRILFKANAANTGSAPTFAVSGLSALPSTMGSVALPIGGLIINNYYWGLVEDSGTSFRVTPYDAVSSNGDTLTGNLNMQDHLLRRPMLTGEGHVVVDKGNVSNATATFDYSAGSYQTFTATGSTVTWAFSNWPLTGNTGYIEVTATNAGAYTQAISGVTWIKPDGTTTTTLATYLAANTGRTAFQTSGIDKVLFWSRDAGTTIYGKLI